MTPVDVIKQAQDEASEWVEMSEHPATLVAGVLATKIVKLNHYIEYLERRLDHDISSTKVN